MLEKDLRTLAKNLRKMEHRMKGISHQKWKHLRYPERDGLLT
jgi:hypothetical protein